MKKKLLAILLALGLVITCMPMVALAEGPGLSVDKTEVKKGEIVTATITFSSALFNIDFSTVTLQVDFDKDLLELAEEASGEGTKGDFSCTNMTGANANGYVRFAMTTNNGEKFKIDNSTKYTAKFKAKSSGTAIIKINENATEISKDDENYIDLPDDFVKSVTLQLTGADGGKTLTKDAHIKGNVLDVAEEYNVVIIYNDDAVYTYIPNDAKDSDINKTYQNAENGVTLSPTDKDTVRGKWCGYGDGVDNVGFDGNKNRITIINGMDVAGTVTATAAKDAGIKGETFSINLTTSDEVDGSANYAILRDACITGSTEEQLNAAFNQCGSSDKFGTRTISTGGFSLGAINTQGNTIKYANIYYSLTGNPGTGMANWGGTVNTTLGTITITVQAA